MRMGLSKLADSMSLHRIQWKCQKSKSYSCFATKMLVTFDSMHRNSYRACGEDSGSLEWLFNSTNLDTFKPPTGKRDSSTGVQLLNPSTQLTILSTRERCWRLLESNGLSERIQAYMLLATYWT